MAWLPIDGQEYEAYLIMLMRERWHSAMARYARDRIGRWERRAADETPFSPDVINREVRQEATRMRLELLAYWHGWVITITDSRDDQRGYVTTAHAAATRALVWMLREMHAFYRQLATADDIEILSPGEAQAIGDGQIDGATRN